MTRYELVIRYVREFSERLDVLIEDTLPVDILNQDGLPKMDLMEFAVRELLKSMDSGDCTGNFRALMREALKTGQ